MVVNKIESIYEMHERVRKNDQQQQQKKERKKSFNLTPPLYSEQNKK